MDREESRRDLSLPMESYLSIDLHSVTFFGVSSTDFFTTPEHLSNYNLMFNVNGTWYFREHDVTIFSTPRENARGVLIICTGYKVNINIPYFHFFLKFFLNHIQIASSASFEE